MLSIKHTILAGSALSAAALLVPFAAGAASPYLILQPYSGAPQSTVRVSGYSFNPSENVSLSLDGTSGSTAADGSGNFTTQLTVPQRGPGSVTVAAHGSQGDSATANFYVTGFYPNAQPSSWYVLPNQQLGLSGSGFAPNETVSITDSSNAVHTQVTTDGNGNFTADNVVTVPFSWQNSTHSFTVTGNTTGQRITLTITVGTFYPNLNPSTYYIGKSQSMSATATGFAPNEPVQLQVNGTTVGTNTADGSGNASFTFTAPSSGSSFTLTANGAMSHVSTTRTITLAQ